MLAEISEILFSKPRKIKRALLFMIHLIMNILFASGLYKRLIGNYYLVDITDLKEIERFIIEGRILVSLLLFFISNYLLFHLFTGALYISVTGFFKIKNDRKIDKTDGKVIIYFLRFFQIIDINPQSGIVTLMKHSNSLYRVASIFAKEEETKFMRRFKNSFLTEVFSTYCVFVLLYFTLISDLALSKSLNILVIMILGLILIFYWSILQLEQTVHKISPDLLILLDKAKAEKILEKVFKDQGMQLQSSEGNKRTYKYFYDGDKKTNLQIITEDRNIGRYVIENFIEISKEKGESFFIITNKRIEPEALQLIDENPDRLSVIKFKNEKDLINKIEEVISRI